LSPHEYAAQTGITISSTVFADTQTDTQTTLGALPAAVAAALTLISYVYAYIPLVPILNFCRNIECIMG